MENEKDLFRYYPDLYPSIEANFVNDFYGASDTQESTLNPRQIFWIKKRKTRRETLDLLMKITPSNYLHESRHNHAMKRLRAPSGRFLTKEEMKEFKSMKQNMDDI
ncbi:Transcriptional activator [Glugoides intestinalis]